jgi:hypothetical protein
MILKPEQKVNLLFNTGNAVKRPSTKVNSLTNSPSLYDGSENGGGGEPELPEFLNDINWNIQLLNGSQFSYDVTFDLSLFPSGNWGAGTAQFLVSSKVLGDVDFETITLEYLQGLSYFNTSSSYYNSVPNLQAFGPFSYGDNGDVVGPMPAGHVVAFKNEIRNNSNQVVATYYQVKQL